ncbi:MAG: uroporphyrinogen-III synthase [Xanthobacteraceae bacterium]|nr:uroporphyrinogen-III synthase [Xanthobacteraceae bacterium]
MLEKLTGYRVLILETREEAMFARMLEDQGAEVVKCPMFVIHDAPDPAPVEAWIKRTLAQPLDDLILLTGEGLRRILKVARRLNVENDFVAMLRKARKFARGPKPVRALREIGLEVQSITETPTSEGVITMLSGFDLNDHRVGLQLYPDKDHTRLIDAISAFGAGVDMVTPYVYDPQAADENIVTAIGEMAAGRIDAIALTSAAQVRRLVDVAKAHGGEEQLRIGLAQTPIASVGPVVSDELKNHGLPTDIYPANDTFFMKPLITAISASLTRTPPRTATIPR